jgi:hypothetical protein
VEQGGHGVQHDAPLGDPTRDGVPSVVGFAYDPGLTERRTSAAGFLVDALRRRPAGRAVLSGLTILLFLGGSGMFAYPFFTDVYTDRVVQQQLADQFGRIEAGSVEEWQETVSTGSPLTKIVMPSIGVETLVVAGTSPAALRGGASHHTHTPPPLQARHTPPTTPPPPSPSRSATSGSPGTAPPTAAPSTGWTSSARGTRSGCSPPSAITATW